MWTFNSESIPLPNEESLSSAKTYEELEAGFNVSAKLTDTKSTAINNVFYFIFCSWEIEILLA